MASGSQVKDSSIEPPRGAVDFPSRLISRSQCRALAFSGFACSFSPHQARILFHNVLATTIIQSTANHWEKLKTRKDGRRAEIRRNLRAVKVQSPPEDK
jgi:hypothetical protein